MNVFARVLLFMLLQARKKRSFSFHFLPAIFGPGTFYLKPTLKTFPLRRVSGNTAWEVSFLWFGITCDEWASTEAFHRGLKRIELRKKKIADGTLQEWEVMDTN